LDQLMGLAESSAKLDAQLDTVCKKIERIALDNAADPKMRLMFKMRGDEGKFFSRLTRTAEYLDFIKTFQWYELKYSTKKSLAELCALITKVRDRSFNW
jgi:hypothetical protein